MDDKIATSAEAHEADALPRRHDVLPDDAVENGNGAQDPHVTQKPVKSKSPAEWAYERLILYFQNFEETLDAEHEVAMGFAGGDAGILKIEGMGFFDPDILTFYGTDPMGAKTQLVQHVSQLSVILRAAPKSPDRPAPTRIGFRLRKDLEKSSQATG
jgi:hypothetical protein